MTEIVVDTLRLRGAHGRRLARVAARALPAALDRALADVDDVEVASVRVVLDLDPEEYDDETLATLWADLVRAELVARRREAPGAVPRAARGGPVASTTTGAPSDLVAAARGWLSLPAEAREAVPAALLALGDPEVAVQVAARLGPAEWRPLVSSLRLVLPVDATVSGVSAPPARDESPGSEVPHGEERSTADPARRVTAPVDAAGGRGAVATPPSAARELVAEAADVVAVLETFRELQAAALTPLDPTVVTRAAGLALLYPWLEDHCHAAEVLHPGLDRYDVREAALAALVADPAAVDDPLVRLLAGREQLREPPRRRDRLPHQDEVDASAERVLASFASLLPGFERSTPGFVRSTWLVRLGVLDLERHPALLTAATHPLDVLLPLLPYPVGLFRLPWSPPLTVRFRP